MTTLLISLLATTAVFEDSFKDKLSNGWTWVREDAAGWKIDSTGLHIRVLPGTLWKAANNARNVLLRQRPADLDDFVLEATVSADPKVAGEQAGLIVYLDDDTYTKIVFESLDGKHWIVFGKETRGEGKMVNRIPADGLKTVRMRLAVSTGKATGSLVQDKGVTEVGQTDFTLAPAMKVGLVSHGGSADADRWATFTGLRLARP